MPSAAFVPTLTTVLEAWDVFGEKGLTHQQQIVLDERDRIESIIAGLTATSAQGAALNVVQALRAAFWRASGGELPDGLEEYAREVRPDPHLLEEAFGAANSTTIESARSQS
jgi:hypothetical protein